MRSLLVNYQNKHVWLSEINYPGAYKSKCQVSVKCNSIDSNDLVAAESILILCKPVHNTQMILVTNT